MTNLQIIGEEAILTHLVPNYRKLNPDEKLTSKSFIVMVSIQSLQNKKYSVSFLRPDNDEIGMLAGQFDMCCEFVQ